MASAHTGSSAAGYCIDLVDKYNTGSILLSFFKRSRTRDAPTPTNISTKSEPEIEKNGTPASPATALARRVFPVPGGRLQEEVPWGSWPHAGIFLRILQEINYFFQFFLLSSSSPATREKFTLLSRLSLCAASAEIHHSGICSVPGRPAVHHRNNHNYHNNRKEKRHHNSKHGIFLRYAFYCIINVAVPEQLFYFLYIRNVLTGDPVSLQSQGYCTRRCLGILADYRLLYLFRIENL